MLWKAISGTLRPSCLIWRRKSAAGVPRRRASAPASAYGITALLRSFALNASRRQLFVPVEAFDDITAPGHIFAGHSSPGLVAALGTLRKRARESLAAFEAQLPQLPVAAMPAFLPVALVPGYLSAMEQPGYDPFKTPVEVSQWRRQWALWRAARRWSRVMRR